MTTIPNSITVPSIELRRCTIGEMCIEDRIIIEPNTEEAAGLPYLGLEHVESGTGTINLNGSISPDTIGVSTTFRFGSKHVLYGKLRPYLNKVALPEFEGRCTTELIPLLPRAGICREFLAWTLRRPQVVDAAMRERTGARMPRADLAHVYRLSLVIPARIDVQRAIANEITAKSNAVQFAKRCCQEQMRLLDIYFQTLLRGFGETAPPNDQASGDDGYAK